MEICWHDANFGLVGLISSLFFPVSISSNYHSNVSVSALVSRLGFAGLDCGI